MRKINTLRFLFIFSLIVFSNNLVFAIQNTDSQNLYPDYAFEFTGKDKCEGFNRKLFVFNLKLNKFILRPVNIMWASVIPKYGMDRFQNVYQNINYPLRLVSCLLQKDFKGSKQETIRFLTNTTLGVGGMYDPAKTKFKLEPRQEDMGQVLAFHNVKQGPYLVLPIVRGNIRDLAGQLLDCPFKPLSYIPIAGGIANAVFSINNTTYIQPIIKKIDSDYADPYQIARQIDGFTRYIKNENLDRLEVLNEKFPPQNIIKINTSNSFPELKHDIALENYNPQSPLIDSLRTSMFIDPTFNKSKWSELSVWNRNFQKKIKMSSISVTPKKPDYKYRYILQKSQNSPLAILYPSIGEGINSDHSNVLAKILYDKGYSVIIQGSAFHWEFIKSMPEDYKPGLPKKDAESLILVTSKIVKALEKNKNKTFEQKLIVGTSYGAMTGLFVAALDEEKNELSITKCVAVNPPIELFFALKELDKNSQDWKNNPTDIKTRAAITAEKVVATYKTITDNNMKNIPETLPFTDDEAKLIISFIMKQKMSDVVFTVENCARCKKTDIYNEINKMSYYDYSRKYLFVDKDNLPEPNPERFTEETSLYCLTNFLHDSEKYKIYHTADDFFVNTKQLHWLKEQTKDKTVLFNNGSHLGFLYRKEFLNQFEKDITLNENLVRNNINKTK